MPVINHRIMKLFSPDAAHWYQRDGVPLHTVLSAKNETAPANVA